MPYISVNHSLKIDLSAHSFSEPFTENSFYGQKLYQHSKHMKLRPHCVIMLIRGSLRMWPE